MPVNKTTPLPPWASATVEPKRKFKFILTLGDIPAWVVKSASRPNLTVSIGAKHSFLGHEFKYPGRVTWENIDITLVEPIDPDISAVVLQVVEKAGYTLPSKWTAGNEGWRTTLSKRKFSSNNLGDVSVKMLDSDGNMVERWTLRNAWVSNLNYSDLDYGGEELTELKITLVFDYADLELFSQG